MIHLLGMRPEHLDSSEFVDKKAGPGMKLVARKALSESVKRFKTLDNRMVFVLNVSVSDYCNQSGVQMGVTSATHVLHTGLLTAYSVGLLVHVQHLMCSMLMSRGTPSCSNNYSTSCILAWKHHHMETHATSLLLLKHDCCLYASAQRRSSRSHIDCQPCHVHTISYHEQGCAAANIEESTSLWTET